MLVLGAVSLLIWIGLIGFWHGYWRANQRLDLHAAFGRQHVRTAINVRAKFDALLGDAAQGRQRHDLKAARVGQDRVGPFHELVQAPKARQALGPGA